MPKLTQFTFTTPTLLHCRVELRRLYELTTRRDSTILNGRDQFSNYDVVFTTD